MGEQHNFIIRYVDDSPTLDNLVQLIHPQKTLYLDLEVDNMYHYHTQMSLLQILINQTCYLVDFTTSVDLKKLLGSFEGKQLVLHGADFDLRTLFTLHDFVPTKVFDTMLAARLVGLEEYGLGSLVQHYFGQTLNKKFQKADWSQRPLPEEMLLYAAQDTYFLPELYKILKQELRDKGRLSWHREWCEQLVASANTVKEVDEERWRIKGSHRMTPYQLNLLKEIYFWREGKGRDKNRPLFKILTNGSMLDLVQQIPPPGTEINQEVPLKTSQSLKGSLFKTIRAARKIPEKKWPQRLKFERNRKKPLNPRLMEHLRSTRDKIAADLNLTPSLLANREALTQIALTELTSEKEMREAVNLMRWQRQLLFEPWLALKKTPST